MKKILALVSFASLAAAVAPVIASAQQLSAINNINDVASKFTGIVNTVTVLLISFAVVWIIVNVVRYLVGGKDSETRKKGGMQILWGIIGLFIIISIWGLVSILKNSFATNNTASQGINNVELQPGSVPPVQ